VQFDGEKPGKITRGACACNDDKVIFENPLNWELVVSEWRIHLWNDVLTVARRSIDSDDGEEGQNLRSPV
jgi:hypothetical protein